MQLFTTSLSKCLEADLILVAVNDEQISGVVKQLSLLPWLEAKHFLHFSGKLNAKVFDCIHVQRHFVGALHPIYNFKNTKYDIEHIAGHYCVFDGDREVLEAVKPLLDKYSMPSFTVSSDLKIYYHVACTMALCFPAVLADVVSQLLKDAAISDQGNVELSNALVCQGARIMLNDEKTAFNFIGPIARIEVDTVWQHLSCLNDAAIRRIYESLGAYLAGKKNRELSFHDLFSANKE